MSELTAGECGHACIHHAQALKRRTITGVTMAVGLGLQLIPWNSVSAQADLISPTLTTVTVIAGAVFGADVLVATGIRIKKWFKNRVIVVHLGPRDRPPGQE